ncbi:lipoprotein [Streptosporangium fragile]|uniref:Lipoprotein n=1 Tax=Streptosporangium fragile TaxID=46186 RepID=A0ABN3VRA8_9ACTN
MRKSLHAGVLALGLLAAGCGGAEEGGTAGSITADQVKASPTSYESPAASPTAGAAKVDLGETKIGKVLVGADGRTLYLFEKDKDGKSACSGDCATAWPPYVTDGKPEAGEGVKEGLLGTTEREDGTKQATYNRHPLYYYAKDTKAGDVLGHDIEGFGAEWYAVNADGKKAKG